MQPQGMVCAALGFAHWPQLRAHCQGAESPHFASPCLPSAAVLHPSSSMLRNMPVLSTSQLTHETPRCPRAHPCLCCLRTPSVVPHRFLQTLPGPVASIAAAVTLLELPVAFLVLAVAPVLQRPTAMALLGLQLLRLAFGPASLANIAAAVLCFLLLDDGFWVPAVVAAAQKLAVLRTGASTDGAQEAEHAVNTGLLSRSSSITSLAGKHVTWAFQVQDCHPKSLCALLKLCVPNNSVKRVPVVCYRCYCFAQVHSAATSIKNDSDLTCADVAALCCARR